MQDVKLMNPYSQCYVWIFPKLLFINLFIKQQFMTFIRMKAYLIQGLVTQQEIMLER